MVIKMDGFRNLEELYNRIRPALKCKVKDLRRIGIRYVQEADIWNYLKKNCWSKSNNITLGDIVNDIMTVSNIELETYVQNLLAKEKREYNKEISSNIL